MEDNNALTRHQDEILSDHLSSVGGYQQPMQWPAPATEAEPSHPTISAQQQLYNMQQQRLHQQQQQQQQQMYRPVPSIYNRRSPALVSATPPGRMMNPAYQGYSNTGGVPMAVNGPIAQLPNSVRTGSPIMRANSMYVTHSGSPAGLRHHHSLSRPAYPRYPDNATREQQHNQQYEQYEQQQHYYRDAPPLSTGLQDTPQAPRGPPYGAPYRQSTYNGIYGGPPQIRAPMIARQQQIQHLQAQRPINLGLADPVRFTIARDQLPTAPSPSVLSSTQPAPVFPEPAQTGGAANGIGNGGANGAPISAPMAALKVDENPVDSENGIAVATPPEIANGRHSNRLSTYSMYSLASPVTADRIPRPMSATLESSPRFLASPSYNLHSKSTTSLNSLGRPGSDAHWNLAANAMLSQSKAMAAHTQSFSRQLTLSSIPANEEVPPMPGKMTSKTGKVRIQLTFDRPFFNAGGELSGRLEVQCSSSRSVMLADMFIELLGYEALTKDHLAPKIFHKTILRLQDVRHASQAVQENIEPDAEGYWVARKGRTIFPFHLNIQDTLPNSYDSKLGQIRYVASAIATMKCNQHKEVVNHTREVFIYETWTTDDITQARRKSVKADTSKRLFMGGEGSLEMYAELTRTMVSSGGIVYVNVGVKNLTKKKIMGIKLSLWRHIAASHPRASISSQSSGMGRDQDNVKNYSEIIYKGEDFAFDNDDPRVVVLPVYIPAGVYSLRNTSFLHVQFFVQVSLLASMSKALAVELPIYITHASSWSDPPPRIPRDFTFPMHEDDPIKKNKTGVFTKKKPNSIVTQTSSNVSSSPRKQPSTGPHSAPASQAGTPKMTSALVKDTGNSRPYTQRSALKDPDSPTSVLDFSQAGSLFVVNPDSSSITTSETGSVMRQPLASRPAAEDLKDGWDEPVMTPTSSSPLDRSAPLMLVERDSPRSSGEPEQPVEEEDAEQDFDMSRSVSAPQIGTTKKEQDKPTLGKMGLRKTLAKLSIAIPHHSSAPNLGVSSRLSPRVLPTTPRSSKSLGMSSTEDLLTASSRSPGMRHSMSRKSSKSSLGSFTARFSHSRKSSGGSNRIMTSSPGDMSPDENQPRLTELNSSSASSSGTRSAPESGVASRVQSGASSPVLVSGPSSTDDTEETVARKRHHNPGLLSMTPAIPDLRLHQGTPNVERNDQEDYFDCNDQDRRSSTLSPIDAAQQHQHQHPQDLGGGDSLPTTPNSFQKPWAMERNFSTSSVGSSVLDAAENMQSAQAIRDEYYYSKGSLSRNMSTDSFETRVAPPLSGTPIMPRADLYESQGLVYNEPTLEPEQQNELQVTGEPRMHQEPQLEHQQQNVLDRTRFNPIIAEREAEELERRQLEEQRQRQELEMQQQQHELEVQRQQQELELQRQQQELEVQRQQHERELQRQQQEREMQRHQQELELQRQEKLEIQRQHELVLQQQQELALQQQQQELARQEEQRLEQQLQIQQQQQLQQQLQAQMQQQQLQEQLLQQQQQQTHQLQEHQLHQQQQLLQQQQEQQDQLQQYQYDSSSGPSSAISISNANLTQSLTTSPLGSAHSVGGPIGAVPLIAQAFPSRPPSQVPSPVRSSTAVPSGLMLTPQDSPDWYFTNRDDYSLPFQQGSGPGTRESSRPGSSHSSSHGRYSSADHPTISPVNVGLAQMRFENQQPQQQLQQQHQLHHQQKQLQLQQQQIQQQLQQLSFQQQQQPQIQLSQPVSPVLIQDAMRRLPSTDDMRGVSNSSGSATPMSYTSLSHTPSPMQYQQAQMEVLQLQQQLQQQQLQQLQQQQDQQQQQMSRPVSPLLVHEPLRRLPSSDLAASSSSVVLGGVSYSGAVAATALSGGGVMSHTPSPLQFQQAQMESQMQQQLLQQQQQILQQQQQQIQQMQQQQESLSRQVSPHSAQDSMRFLPSADMMSGYSTGALAGGILATPLSLTTSPVQYHSTPMESQLLQQQQHLQFQQQQQQGQLQQQQDQILQQQEQQLQLLQHQQQQQQDLAVQQQQVQAKQFSPSMPQDFSTMEQPSQLQQAPDQAMMTAAAATTVVVDPINGGAGGVGYYEAGPVYHGG